MSTILVVDDEISVTELMRDWLILRRYEVLTAVTAADALAIVRSTPPDLILLDDSLPDASGVEALRTLLAEGSIRDTPVIVIAEGNAGAGRSEALLAGASDYITKPVNLDDLGHRIAALLAHGDESLHYSERLMQETVHAALSMLRASLAWLLVLDDSGTQLTSRAIATRGPDSVTQRFLATARGSDELFALSAEDDGESLVARVMATGAPAFNLPLSELNTPREEAIYRAAEDLSLYFVTVVPLHLGGKSLGVLLIGARESVDLETSRGQQILAALVSQAATAIENARLVQKLVARNMQSSQERAFREMVLDHMGDGLLVCDASRIINFANQRLAEITGYAIENLYGMNFQELVTDADREYVIESLMGSETRNSFEFDLLRADSTTLPVLCVQASGSNVESMEHVLVITDLSEHRAGQRMLVKQSERLAALNRAAQAISSSLQLDEALEMILSEAANALGGEMASIMLRPPGGDQLFMHSSVGPGSEVVRGMRIPVAESIAGYVAREGLPVLVDDAYADPRFYARVDELTGVPTGSIAAVPLMVQDEPVGTLEILSTVKGAFDLDDIQIAQGLARSAAVAIENASLFDETQRQVRELTLLLKVSEAASSTLAIENVLETVARQLLDALSATWCIISMWDEENDSLVNLAEVAEVFWPADRGRVIDPTQLPLVEQALAGSGYAIAIDTPDVDPRRREALLNGGYWSVLGIPLTVGGSVVGVAELYHTSSRVVITDRDLDACQTAAAHRIGDSGSDWRQPDMLSALSDDMLKASGATWCVIAENDPGKGLHVIFERGRAVWPIGQGQAQRLEEVSLRRVALVERTAVASHFGEGSALSEAEQASLPDVGEGVLLFAPLVARGEAIGLVQLIDIDVNRQFEDEELSLAQAIANVVGNALQNGQLYSALARRAAQLEAAYHDLREADRLKDELIQNVSHELRTPLAAIMGYIDMLSDQGLGPLAEDQVHAISVISEQSRLLARMVADILLVQEMRHQALHRSPASLAMLSRSALNTIQPVLQSQSNIRLETQISDAVPEIEIDREMVRQAIENLLSNAIKFSPDGGTVTLTVTETPDAVCVSVADEGIGIPEEEFDKIWQRFYQVDGSTTRRFGGVGLGLTIVRHVVDRHGGDITVESSVGEGSTFTMMLPKSPPELPELPTDYETAPKPRI